MNNISLRPDSNCCSCEEESPKDCFSQPKSYLDDSRFHLDNPSELESKILDFLQNEGIRFVDPSDRFENYWEEKKEVFLNKFGQTSTNDLASKLTITISNLKKKKCKTF